MLFLLWIGRRYSKQLRNGDIFLIYLIGYPTGRFFLEFLRLDSSQIVGINANQTVMLVVAIAAAIILFARRRLRPSSTIETTQEKAPPIEDQIS